MFRLFARQDQSPLNTLYQMRRWLCAPAKAPAKAPPQKGATTKSSKRPDRPATGRQPSSAHTPRSSNVTIISHGPITVISSPGSASVSNTPTAAPQVAAPQPPSFIPSNPSRLYRLEFDGASRSNQNLEITQAGAGAVLYDDSTGEQVAILRQSLGRANNNQAEAAALLLGMQAARLLGMKRLKVQGDSDGAVRQAMGTSSARCPTQRMLIERVMKVKDSFEEFSIEHIPRKENTVADKLSQEAMEQSLPQGLEQRVRVELLACNHVVALLNKENAVAHKPSQEANSDSA